METIKDFNDNYFLNKTKSETHHQNEFPIKLKTDLETTDYFEYIYSYPPKIKIKWEASDHLKDTLFSDLKRFKNIFLFGNRASKNAVIKNYSKSQYIDGFVDKINSSNFFLKKTERIQNALANIPVFILMNGHGEIVLNKPSELGGSKTIPSYVEEKLYDSCGAFDLRVEKRSELGLFFMNYEDAEKYLKELARSDFQGMQTVGLSINCISLDSAYKITREYHPGIDFRFIPNFNEVKNLLTKGIGKTNFMVDFEQGQLQFRPRHVNMFPYLNQLGRYFSPSFSFLQRNDYFKGVPIYIVQLTSTPRNFWFDQSLKIMGMVDSTISSTARSMHHLVGFGQSRIIQGSLLRKATSNLDKVENYIFFEKDQAIEFSKKGGRKIARYGGASTGVLDPLVRKPKIFLYNLEDFLEDWENFILTELNESRSVSEKLFKEKINTFIVPTNIENSVVSFPQNFQKSSLKNFISALNIKYNVLKRSVGVFFSTN